MQLLLSAPDITCEHCIATIKRTVDAIEGARFVEGDHEARSFAVEVASGALLDAVGAALASEGYPLGDAPTVASAGTGAAEAAGASLEDWTPEYRVTRTDAGADVNYACPCSCDAGFALDRSHPEQAPESCCCGRQILVGADAEARLVTALEDASAYRIEVQTVAMPWGQPLPVALATPSSGAEHESAG